MNVIPIDPHLITSRLEICGFLVFVDECVVSYPKLIITFCFDGDTLVIFCLDGYKLITFCAVMNNYRYMVIMLMYGYLEIYGY